LASAALRVISEQMHGLLDRLARATADAKSNLCRKLIAMEGYVLIPA
jgi:hypothetical protein